MKPKMIFIFLLGGLCAVIVLQNTEVVTYQFLVWKLSMSRIIFLPIIFSCGVLVGFMLGKR